MVCGRFDLAQTNKNYLHNVVLVIYYVRLFVFFCLLPRNCGRPDMMRLNRHAGRDLTGSCHLSQKSPVSGCTLGHRHGFDGHRHMMVVHPAIEAEVQAAHLQAVWCQSGLLRCWSCIQMGGTKKQASRRHLADATVTMTELRAWKLI